MYSRALVTMKPIPDFAAIVSATIKVTHMRPNDWRKPTKIEGAAPKKIT